MKWNALWDVWRSLAFAVGVCGGVRSARPAAGGVDTPTTITAIEEGAEKMRAGSTRVKPPQQQQQPQQPKEQRARR